MLMMVIHSRNLRQEVARGREVIDAVANLADFDALKGLADRRFFQENLQQDWKTPVS